MREALNENIDLADEYDIINECADEYSRVDADALIAVQEEELNKIAPMFNMSWTLFAYIFFECFIVGCLFCCKSCERNNYECRGQCSKDLCFNLEEFYQLVTKLGG